MRIIANPDRRQWRALMERCITGNSDIDKRVEDIVSRVRNGGDSALRTIVKEIDGYAPECFEVSEEIIDTSISQISLEIRSALDVASANIRRFHEAQLRIDPVIVETMPGVRCEQRVLPINRVGLYIPGGSAPLFSTVLMLAIPARIAGCNEVVMCTPCGPDGRISPYILYAARLSGVDKIYALGGAQAIAAMAYGTESIPRVYKIFGPGNRYVTRAKQLVAADNVAIDMPAGPSEVMVLADNSADPVFVAADLLSQAEHGPDSQGIVLCLDEHFAIRISTEVDRLIGKLSRTDILNESLNNCRIIILPDTDSMVEFANEYAAEHLIINTQNANQLADRIVAAGSIFIGSYSPESAGDYASGTNHTLPTGGWATSLNGINTDSFLRRITVQELTKPGLEGLAPTIINMAMAEGLDAHALAVKVRTDITEQ